MPVSALAVLTIEDAGDDRVGVMSSQAAHQCDRVLIGAHDCRTRTGQIEVDVGESTAPPTQREVRAAFVFVDCDDDLLEQRAQQLLLVARRRGWGLPGFEQVGAEGEQTGAFVHTERPGTQLFATCKLGLGLFQFAQALLPLGLDATGDETVVGVDGAIATFGALRVVACPLDRETPLRQRAVVVGFDALRRGERGLDTERRERGKHSARRHLVDLYGADVEASTAAIANSRRTCAASFARWAKRRTSPVV